ncbi:hypothetical protein [Polaribacter sp. OB-PA-B3]
MKINLLKIFGVFLLVFLCKSCKEKETSTAKIIPEYVLKISQTKNTNAPALQSFTHAESLNGEEWLLFAGRTNSLDSLNGGIHNLNGNYAGSSFTKSSYNDVIYVYNPINDEISGSLTLTDFISVIENKYNTIRDGVPAQSNPLYQLLQTVKENSTIFKNSNALVKQKGNYLYTLGGYGPEDFTNLTKGFTTYNHVAKINVSNLIKLVKEKKLRENEWTDLLKVGKNNTLISTGGELYIFDDVLYLSLGHSFGNSAPKFSEGQKYLNAVYPFTVSNNKENISTLNIQVKNPISDISNPTSKASDTISVFRRRDGPILPSLYKNPTNNSIEKSIAIYTGVFKPGHPLKAWNDAIYVHPNYTNDNNKLYTYDATYNQKNFNVYSCPSVVLFDTNSNYLHSFLIGGIGDGKGAPKGHLSGFTNSSVQISMDINSLPLKSTPKTLNYNIFKDQDENSAPFYGAEAIMFPNREITYSKYSDEIIDVAKSFSSDKKTINVGFIFGGIEAFESNPGTYGKNKSQASNKIWKVEITKNSI